MLTLAKRLPEIADPNPVKIALGLVKLIIEIQQVRRGSSHCSHLLTIAPGCGRQYGYRQTKAKFDASSAGNGGEGTGWLDTEDCSRKPICGLVHTVKLLFSY